MRTFAEMGWNPWTGVLMIYGYGVFLSYLRISLTTKIRPVGWRGIGAVAMAFALAACGHSSPSPSPTVQTTTTTHRTVTATTTPTAPSTAPSTTLTRTPFVNPPNSTGLGKG